MSRLEIALLGPPIIQHEGSVLHFRTRKALALLIYLAVEGGAHTREEITLLFWAESDAAHGRQMLRTTLAHLRTALGISSAGNAPDHLILERETLAFDFHTPYRFDFQLLDDALKAKSAQASVPQLEATLAFVRGEFAQGLTLDEAPEFEQWLIRQRERYHPRVSLLLDRLSQLYMDGGEAARASELAARWVTHDPLDEKAYQRSMRLAWAQGDRTTALRIYEQLRTVLHTELNAEPAPETLALALQLQRANPRTPFGTAPNKAHAPAFSPQALVTATPLVGRHIQMAQLIAAGYAARGGQTALVMLEGEAGIGKTRLATEFANYFSADGGEVLKGRAFETGGQLPYQPLLDAMRARLERENAPDDLLGDVWLAELARLLPELRERYPDLAPSPDDSPTRLFEAFARLGSALAEYAPVLFLIDDLQWADNASLDMLSYALRRWQEMEARVIVLGTLRAEAVPALSSWLAQAARSASLTRVPLTALSADNTLQLVTALAGASSLPGGSEDALREFSSWLYAETNGQPFFMVETLKALLERGDVAAVKGADNTWVLDLRTPAHPLQPPADMQQVVQARLDRLSPDALDLLRAAAVLGQAATFEAVRAVSGIAENPALSALDILIASGLMREAEGLLNVGHDRIRDVVYAATGDTRRRVLHRRAYEWLSTHNGSAVSLARHAVAAGLEGHAFHALVAAGDQALQVFAVRDAIPLYERARELSGDVLLNPQLYLQLGRAYELVSEPRTARVTYERLLELAQAANQPVAEAGALNRLAILAMQSLDVPRALALSARALERTKLTNDPLLIAETNWNIAQIHMYQGNHDPAILYGQAALSTARALNQPELVARTLNMLGYAYGGAGLVTAALDASLESRSGYATLGNRAMEGDSLIQVASALRRQGKSQQAIATAQEAFALNRGISNTWGAVGAQVQIALATFETGDWGTAFQSSRQALDEAKAHNLSILLMLARLAHATIARGLLAFELARGAIQEFLDVETVPALVGTALAELAAVEALAGNWDAAYAAVHQSHRVGRHALTLIHTGLWLECIALVKRGENELAVRQVADFAAQVHDNPRYEIVLLQAGAVVARAGGDTTQACAALEQAVTRATRLELPSELWLLEGKLGILYSSLAQETLAQEHLARAQAIVRQLAATIPERGLADQFRERAGWLLAGGMFTWV